MSNISYFSGWKQELCIQLETGDNNKADFNRILVKHLPKTEQLQLNGTFEDAGRTNFTLQLKERFDEAINEGGSHFTLLSLYNEAALYLRWCDDQDIKSFTQSSIEGYTTHLDNRVKLGSLKSSTYTKKRSRMVKIFTEYLELPHYYFSNVIVRDKSDIEPFEAYTKSDIKQLLPFLRALFKQTHQQFIENPKRHMRAHQSVHTMTFTWRGCKHRLCGGISKMMCAATYLLAYYTYANTSDLLQLKQPENASTTVGEIWYTMPAFKRRAFKTIHVEMGGHEIDIPKYSLDFFDKLLEASKLISKDEHATLLQTTTSKQVRPIRGATLQDFLSGWVEKHFTFIDQVGRRLRPVISRFRETGAQLTAYHQGEIVNNIMLNNTPGTRQRHYSEGNKISNNGMMQDAMAIREEQVKHSVNINQAKKILELMC